MLDTLSRSLYQQGHSGSSSKTSSTSVEEQQLHRQQQQQQHERSQQLYAKLAQVDPAAAERLHPNDWRHIQRALDIYEQVHHKPSELTEGQQPQLRFDCCFLWTACDSPERLHQRLNDRVETMMQRGLLQELRQLYEVAPDPNNIDFQKGLFQAIGRRW
jgi:tRNA dimethylallyltransferase